MYPGACLGDESHSSSTGPGQAASGAFVIGLLVSFWQLWNTYSTACLQNFQTRKSQVFNEFNRINNKYAISGIFVAQYKFWWVSKSGMMGQNEFKKHKKTVAIPQHWYTKKYSTFTKNHFYYFAKNKDEHFALSMISCRPFLGTSLLEAGALPHRAPEHLLCCEDTGWWHPCLTKAASRKRSLAPDIACIHLELFKC